MRWMKNNAEVEYTGRNFMRDFADIDSEFKTLEMRPRGAGSVHT